MKISFIVPCYNEADNVKLFYDNVVKNFKKSSYRIELIFINDGSKDNTFQELKKLIKENLFEIKIINFSKNFGKEAGIYAGLRECSGDYAVLIDADMQQPPSLVLDMLKVIDEDPNIDIVSYYQETRIENKIISILKSRFYKIMSNVTGLNLKNGASDFRLMNRKVIDTILSLKEHNRFMKGMFGYIGFNTYFIPYKPNERVNGKTSWNFKSLIKYAINGIFSFAKNPMKLIFEVGIFNILISYIALVIKIFINYISLKYLLILFLIFNLSGLHFIFIGLIGEYIYRIYTEELNRPIYIVKDVLTNEKNI